MKRAFFPIIYSASPAVAKRLGQELGRAAVLALRAVLKNGRSLEVAHQQIRFVGEDLAFSTRISGHGELVIEFDIGDPRLADRIVLEDDLRQAERKVRGIAAEEKRRRA
jgi:hypothetical protein